MSILQNRLKELVGQEIVVVMRDSRSFRGTLVNHDGETVILRQVVEGLPNNNGGWEEPTASTGIVHKVVTWRGTFSHDDTRAEVVKLKDVMIQLSGVLRIWEWSMSNIVKAEHTEAGEASEPRPGTRVRRTN